MSEKPKLEIITNKLVDEEAALEEKLKDPEFKKKYDEAMEESKKFDMDERAAYLMDQVYPNQLMQSLKTLAKNKPNALTRVIYNEVLHPFNMVDYLTKEEKELSGLINQILMAKRQILNYAETRKQTKLKEENKENKDGSENTENN